MPLHARNERLNRIYSLAMLYATLARCTACWRRVHTQRPDRRTTLRLHTRSAALVPAEAVALALGAVT